VSEAVTSDRTAVLGRYALHGEIASGGMAVVYFGKLLGPVGFSRPVAIKRLHPQLARDPALRDMFIDEARLASRIRHPNVVPMLDVVDEAGELLLVMEYVHGESLQQLARAVRARGERIPLRIVLAIMSGVLHGLHAAHEATTEEGEPLNIVHRDVSPQNVLLGVDGVPRVLDFGIARATVRLENTREGIVKGKLAYMAPEQLGGVPVDRRADIFSTSVLLWEMLTGRRLFVRDDGASVLVDKLLRGAIEPPSTHAPELPKLLDAITLHGLARNPEQRFETAREMALALEKFGDLARPSEIGVWVEGLAAESLAERKGRLKELETKSSTYRIGRGNTGAVSAVAQRANKPVVDVQITDSQEDEEDESLFPTRVLTSSMPSPHAVSIAPPPVGARSAVVVRGARRPAPRPLLVFGAYALLGASLMLAALTLRRGPRVADDAGTAAAPATSSGVVSATAYAPTACPPGMARIAGGKSVLRGADGPGTDRAARSVVVTTVTQFCVDLAPASPESHEAATAYCRAQGKRLPTEAEREIATKTSAVGPRDAAAAAEWTSESAPRRSTDRAGFRCATSL
jgi:serine/threonine protein kinase